jgi:hypothetical protein
LPRTEDAFSLVHASVFSKKIAFFDDFVAPLCIILDYGAGECLLQQGRLRGDGNFTFFGDSKLTLYNIRRQQTHWTHLLPQLDFQFILRKADPLLTPLLHLRRAEVTQTRVCGKRIGTTRLINPISPCSLSNTLSQQRRSDTLFVLCEFENSSLNGQFLLSLPYLHSLIHVLLFFSGLRKQSVQAHGALWFPEYYSPRQNNSPAGSNNQR